MSFSNAVYIFRYNTGTCTVIRKEIKYPKIILFFTIRSFVLVNGSSFSKFLLCHHSSVFWLCRRTVGWQSEVKKTAWKAINKDQTKKPIPS